MPGTSAPNEPRCLRRAGKEIRPDHVHVSCVRGMAHRFVYKLLTQQQHDQLYAGGDVTEFDGVEIDKADGFVHLSHASEVIETASRYFPQAARRCV